MEPGIRAADAIRNDLQLAKDESLSVVQVETFDPTDPWQTQQKAVVVIQSPAGYRLAEVHQELTSTDPNVFEWSIGTARTRNFAGVDVWLRFVRRFDHDPTVAEIDEFKAWVDQW